LKAQREWEESEPCKCLTAALKNIPTVVDRVIALSCGSLSRDDNRPVARSSVQHALALTVRRVLIEKQGGTGTVPCYAQDPGYSPIDESLLTEVGFTVLDDPGAFIAVDDSSLVICVASDAPVRQIIADLAKPAALIWDKVDPEDAPDSLLVILISVNLRTI
jgi:hypothetical protein